MDDAERIDLEVLSQKELDNLIYQSAATGALCATLGLGLLLFLIKLI